MNQTNLIRFPEDRIDGKTHRARDRLNVGRKGRVYSRGGKLWVDFYYLGQRVREPAGVSDTRANKEFVRKQLDVVVAEIEAGVFEFARRFPHSSKRDVFTQLEGKNLRKDPDTVTFGDYVSRWWEEMRLGMTDNQIRDYTSILQYHLLPYFEQLPFSEFNAVAIKKFAAHLASKTNHLGKPLSAKRIQNIMIPLRVIVRDAVVEFGWSNLVDPFAGVRLPQVNRVRVFPFDHTEWQILMKHMHDWYRLYFTFAVQTGLRPSEQVALKWTAVDERYIHIELSRVRNREKTDLKTEKSRRSIAIRPAMAETLRLQRELTAHFESPYVFVNTQGRPILQDKLRELWMRVMNKSGLRYRRMYEIRHTFASWALASGETPEWVARTLGHVDTSMVYRTYGRYIPNLTRQDGSAFERMFTESVQVNTVAEQQAQS